MELKKSNIMNKLETTHICSTDLIRPVEEIKKDIEARGMKVTAILKTTKTIFVHCPKNINAFQLRGIKGVVAAAPDYKIHI